MKNNSQRYRRIHDWYYIYRGAAAPEKLELNFKLRQRILKDCLAEALTGKPLPKLIIRALDESFGDVLSGYYNQLLIPVNIGRGAQGLHKVEEVMIHTAVSYIALCKSGAFDRKNPINFICESHGVSRSTVQSWYNDERFLEWRNKPIPFTSQDAAEAVIQETGEIYKNNKKSRKKA